MSLDITLLFYYVLTPYFSIHNRLQSVAARAGPEAVVLLVGTHLDDSGCTEGYLSEIYSQLYNKYHIGRPKRVPPHPPSPP